MQPFPNLELLVTGHSGRYRKMAVPWHSVEEVIVLALLEEVFFRGFFLQKGEMIWGFQRVNNYLVPNLPEIEL